MELRELTGLHQLSGVSENNQLVDKDWEHGDNYDAALLSFILDGITYTAIEDNNDGYRSACRDIEIGKYVCENIFNPISVLGIYKDKDDYGSTSDIIQFYDTQNGKLILQVGTDNTNDYYPSFVALFIPENI